MPDLPSQRVEQLRRGIAEQTDAEARLGLMLDLSDELFYVSPSEAESCLHQVIEQAQECSLPETAARGRMGLAFLQYQNGKLDEALNTSAQTLSEARVLGNGRLEASANNVLGIVHWQKGDWDTAIRHYEECLRISREIGFDGGVSTALSNLALVYAPSGRPEMALECYQQSLQLEQKRQDWAAMAITYTGMGQCCEELGDWERALEYYYRTLAMAEQHDYQAIVAQTLAYLGEMYRKRGRVDRALDLLGRALGPAQALGYAGLRAEICGKLADAYLSKGDTLTARSVLKECEKLAASLESKTETAQTHRRMAELLLASGDPDAALTAVQSALALDVAMGYEIEQGISRRVQAQILAALARPGPAQESFEQAIAILSGRVSEPRMDANGQESGGKEPPVNASEREKGEGMKEKSKIQNPKSKIPAPDGKPGRGFSYELGLAYSGYGRFLAAQGDKSAAREQIQRAAELFRRLGIVQAAEEANRFLLSLRTAAGRPEDAWVALIHNLSNLVAWPAPVSELADACLNLLSKGLNYEAGAFFFYARRPYTVGRVSLSALLAIPRDKEIAVQADSVRIPINYRGRNVGVLYLSEPVGVRDPASDGRRTTDPGRRIPDICFWETVANLLALVAERIRQRVRAADEALGIGHEALGLTPDTSVAATFLSPWRSAKGELRSTNGEFDVRTSSFDVPGGDLKFGTIVSGSAALQEVLDAVERVAPTRASVLIRGESGTGKELIAQAIHDLSPRHSRPLIIINCAALPETLLEAELFGIEKGTATGIRARIGKLEQAEAGTVFLDEIGDMSLPLQSKLLRVLQERTFERVGGRKTIEVDVRFLAATNCDLADSVRTGQFREDLFHRLNVVTLVLPPLRERKEEIPRFIEYFIRRYSEEFMRPIQAMTGAAMDALLAYPWPGNVRELENVIERAVIVAREGIITSDDLPPSVVRDPASVIRRPTDDGRRTTEDELRMTDLKVLKRTARREVSATIEKDLILRLLEKHHWLAAEVGRELGVSRSHLYRLLNKYGIRRPAG